MTSQNTPLATQLSHRLPTVSASQALEGLHARDSRTIPTGLTQLNTLLSPQCIPGHDALGGYPRGKVTEIFGPSGVGKTAFGVQAAVNALHKGQHVVWIDAACAPLISQRVLDVLAALQELPQREPGAADTFESGSPALDELSSHFHHFTTPSLAHLLALLMHPPASFPPRNTSLVITDSLSTLIDNAYPRNVDTKHRNDQSRWAAGRRFAVVNELISTLSKFAALHNLALLVTCQTITRIRGSSRAVLVPAISGVEWENGISTRLVLFRDWVRTARSSDSTDANRLRRARFVGLVKANGLAMADEGGVGNVVPFVIDQAGLHDISMAADNITTPVLATQNRPPKRPFAEVDKDTGEEPNSDELYGWIEDDEVATEGLLIEESSSVDADTSDTRTSKISRPITMQ